ncbi:MAG TPA: hypothetical protein VGI19_08715, partial [Candidatus Cybelea sp.]
MLRAVCCIFALGVVAAVPSGFPSPPPLPLEKPVAETMYGTSVTDPYRYFENMQDPTVQRFFKEQNAYTRAVLARLGPARDQLFTRIKALDNAGVIVNGVTRVGPYYFYEKLNPGDNSPKLYMRNVDGSGERILVDPQSLATAGKHYTINYFLPSLDGKLVAYGISEGGSEASVIHVVDTATAHVFPDSISRCYFIGATSWLPDGKSFYYVRFPELKPGEPETDKETRAVAYLHVLGRDPDTDVPVFGYGVNPKIPFAPTDFPVVVYSPASPYMLGIIAHGVQNERVIYATRAPMIDSANVPWTLIARTEDDVVGQDIKDSTIFLLTHKDAPTYKIVATSLESPNLATAATVVPAGRDVLEDLQVASDGLYVLSRLGGFGQISRNSLAAEGTPGAKSHVTLPFQGSINAIATDSREPGVTFGLTGWTHSLLY